MFDIFASGLQVVDMFGSRLPVCAAGYSCINELMQEGHNGLLFTSAEGLADCLQRMLEGFPSASTQCLQLRETMKRRPFPSWDDLWQQKVLPILQNNAQPSGETVTEEL